MKKLLALATLLLATPALAQTVTQSGTVTRNHIPYWVTSGVIGDSGSATDSPISGIGITNEGGPGFCVSSQRASAAGRQQLCFSVGTSTGATISLNSLGTAPAEGIQFAINGVTQGFPTVNLPIVAGDFPCFLNTSGTLQDCGAVATLESFSGGTQTVKLQTAIAAGALFVRLTQTTTLTSQIAIPANFTLDCAGHTINQGADLTSLFTMGEGSRMQNCRLNGNGTIYNAAQDDMIDITSGNNQRLANVDIVNTTGYNLNFSANVGGNFSWIGGSFNRTCSTPYTISSGTYNSTSGLVILTTTGSVAFGGGTPVTAESLTGTGAFDSLRGPYTSVTASGTTVSYTAASGLGAITITGGFLLACPSNINDAITFAASEAGTTGPRNFVDLNGNGSWGFNLNGGHFISIEGGSMQCMDFNNNANYFFLHNLRLACHGNPNILGTNGFIYGTIFDAGVTIGSGAQYIKLEQLPAFSDTDSSGNATNQIIPSASNTYTQYMAGGNTVGWQLEQAGSLALTIGTDASNNPYIRGQNSLPLGIGINSTNYWVFSAGSILETNIAAPSTPASSFVSTWTDSTDLRFHDKNSAGTIGTTVVSSTLAAHNFANSIGTNGVLAGAQPAIADVSGWGTGVATALGVNIGTAGSFVVNGGALGSPSSAGTIPAFTLGGTIAGGGNSLNNIIVGATTPLAGTFTLLTAATTGAPLAVNSTNSNGAKIALEDNGVAHGYFGGSSTYALTVLASDASNNFFVTGVASAANYIVVTPTVTGSVPSLSIAGDANRNFNLAAAGTGIITLGQALCTASGSTPQTCNGQRGIVTTGTLTTATNTDAAYTINNSSVATTSLIGCTIQAYSGTLVTAGVPHISSCVPGSTTITVHITNINPTNALNGTVQIGFVVLN